MAISRHTALFILVCAACLTSMAYPAAMPETPDDPETVVYVKSIEEADAKARDFEEQLPDSLPLPKPVVETDWWKLLKKGKLNLADTTVRYPKFLGFCVKVYNWADKTFNSYDTTYVVGTGRRWKVRLTSDNWVDSYYLNLEKKMPIRMMSDFYCNVGAYLQYMAVSVGYSVDFSNIFGHEKSRHKKMEFNFNCARFNIEGHYWENDGGTMIRTFGEYKGGHLVKIPFHGAKMKTFGLNGYYFFNNRKFAMGAAYNFSKFQKKSAGSAIIGFNYNNLDISMDMHSLPEELKPYLTIKPEDYRFHYRSYGLMSGYSFNWVLNRHWLFNISAFPGIGLTQAYADNVEANSTIFSVMLKGQGSLTYNLGDFFLSAIAKIDGNWYKTDSFSFFSSVENAQFSIGYRF